MAVIWADGADFKQTFTSPPSSYAFQVLAIPAGSQVLGAGVLAIAIAMNALPGAVSDLNSFSVYTIQVQDSLGNVVYSNGVSEMFPVSMLNVVPPEGGSIWLAGLFSDATETITGSVVACLESSPLANPQETHNFVTVGREGSGTTSGTASIGPLSSKVTDLLVAEAAGVTDNSGNVDFTPGANWVNVIQRTQTNTACGSNVNNFPGSPMTTSPQTFVPFAVGTLPASVTAVTGVVTLGESGIGTSPAISAYVSVRDSSNVELVRTTPSYVLPSNGGQQFYSFTLNPPAGSSGVSIVVSWASAPPAGIQIKVAWQVVCWCNHDSPHNYAVGIGEYTGNLGVNSVPYTLTYPGPASTSREPSGAGLYAVDAFQRPFVASNWAAVIGD